MENIINKSKKDIQEIINQKIMEAMCEGEKLCIKMMLEYLEKEDNGAYDKPEIKDFIDDFAEIFLNIKID